MVSWIKCALVNLPESLYCVQAIYFYEELQEWSNLGCWVTCQHQGHLVFRKWEKSEALEINCKKAVAQQCQHKDKFLNPIVFDPPKPVLQISALNVQLVITPTLVYSAIIYGIIITNNERSHANNETLRVDIYRAGLSVLNAKGLTCEDNRRDVTQISRETLVEWTMNEKTQKQSFHCSFKYSSFLMCQAIPILIIKYCRMLNRCWVSIEPTHYSKSV